MTAALTVDDHARVIALTRMGLTADDIAARLGVSDRTIIRIRRRSGIAQPYALPLTEDERQRAAQLLDDGASYAETARTIGRAPSTVRRAFPGRGWTDRQRYDMVSLVQRHRGLL